MSAATSQWIPPLPPNYEARWDPNQNAYFFINHVLKQTTWQDPRPEYYANHPRDDPPPNPKHSAHGETVFGFRGSGNVPKKEQTFLDKNEVKFNMLKEMFPDVPDETLMITLKLKHYNIVESSIHLKRGGYKAKKDLDNTATGQSNIENTVKKLQKIYPVARYDIIRDIVAGCNGSEENARQQLESMGYNAIASAAGHPKPASQKRSKQRSRSPSPRPSPPKISDAEKQRVFNRMKGKHHDMGEDMLRIALEAVNYKEEDFERMYSSMSASSSSGAHAGPSTSTRTKISFDDDISFKPTGSLVPETFTGGNEAVVFSHDINETEGTRMTSPIPFSSPKPSTTVSNQKTSPKKAKSDTVSKMTTQGKKSPTKAKSDTVSKMLKQPANRETIDQHAARMKAAQKKQVQHNSRETIEHHDAGVKAYQKQILRTKQREAINVGPAQTITDQPRSILARGPDPSNRKGPDRELLLQEYATASGPNPEYHLGPDRRRVQGPQGAVGPDVLLACGPQAVHHANIGNTELLVASV